MTSYAHRLSNLPAVLDTIYAQTVQPDLVVLNLAFEEIVPDEVQKYLIEHHVEVNRVPDTKVYKKILPTLKKYPDDCIICIDDDWLYPEGMIEDFVETHKRYPNNPISGAHYIDETMMSPYHTGCAALVKLDYFNGLLDLIDKDLIENCPSSDFVYTYFAKRASHPYIRTCNDYSLASMKQYNERESYTKSFGGISGLQTVAYLYERFGKIDNNFYAGYIGDERISQIMFDIFSAWQKKYDVLTSTNTYKLALKFQSIIRVFRKLKRH